MPSVIGSGGHSCFSSAGTRTVGIGAGTVNGVAHPVRQTAVRSTGCINRIDSLDGFDAVTVDRHPLFADVGNGLRGGDCCLFRFDRGGDDLGFVGLVLVVQMPDVPLLTTDGQSSQQERD